MNQHRTSAELKAYAKGTLIGKYGTAIAALIVIQLIVQGIIFLTSSAINQNTISGILIYYLILVIITLITAVFSVGQISLYLNMASNQPYKVSNVFDGFKKHPDKAIVIQFLIFAISLGAMLPAGILGVICIISEKYVLLMAVALLAIAGIVTAYFFLFRFSQAFYMILDFPDYTVKELLSLSNDIMKGNCGRLFYITISFIPLSLLGLLSCGIGFLYIIPYQNMTMTYFYLDLIKCRENNQTSVI